MIIWLTGIPGIGKSSLADSLKKKLQNGKRYQVLDAGEVRKWVHPSTKPSVEEQVAAVYWIAELLATNDINVIVSCVSPSKFQRTAIRHASFDNGVDFYEVWVDGNDVPEDLHRRFNYEPPDPPDSRAYVLDNNSWDELADSVIQELDL